MFPIDDTLFFFHWGGGGQSPALTVLTLSHLTSCTLTISNLYLANSLTAVIRGTDISRHLAFHVPNFVFFSHCVGRTKRSVYECGTSLCFVTMPGFTVLSCWHLAQSPIWRTTPCRLYVPAYSIYSQLPSILEAVPPSAT